MQGSQLDETGLGTPRKKAGGKKKTGGTNVEKWVGAHVLCVVGEILVQEKGNITRRWSIKKENAGGGSTRP